MAGGTCVTDATAVGAQNVLAERVGTFTVGHVFVAHPGAIVDACLLAVLVNNFVMVVIAHAFVSSINVTADVVASSAGVVSIAFIDVHAFVKIRLIRVTKQLTFHNGTSHYEKLQCNSKKSSTFIYFIFFSSYIKITVTL